MAWGNHTKYYFLLIGVLGVIPFLVPPFYAGLTVKILLLAIFAMSLDILLGYTGLFSFGHVIGWGLGGYTVGILVSLNILHNFWALLGMGLLIALGLNAILGFLALRTSTLYFALVTLSFAELLRSVALKWRDFTGGVDGISGIPKPWEMGETSFYYFVLAFFLLCLVLMRLLVDSRFGQVLVGIRENEPRMQLMGYNTWIYKYLALLFTGVMATIAGVLFCYDTGYVGPGDLGFGLSGQGLLMVLIGGMGTLMGPFIGAVVLVILSDILSTYSSHWMFILGTIFVLSVLIIPKGIGGYFIKS